MYYWLKSEAKITGESYDGDERILDGSFTCTLRHVAFKCTLRHVDFKPGRMTRELSHSLYCVAEITTLAMSLSCAEIVSP